MMGAHVMDTVGNIIKKMLEKKVYNLEVKSWTIFSKIIDPFALILSEAECLLAAG